MKFFTAKIARKHLAWWFISRHWALVLSCLLASCAMFSTPADKGPALSDEVRYSQGMTEGSHEVPWADLSTTGIWPGTYPALRKLDISGTERVAVLESRYRYGEEGGPIYRHSSLLRVTRGDKVVHDASKCEVHGVVMRRQIEEGKDGSGKSDAFNRLRKRAFPNDGNVYLLCSSGIPHMTWRCPACHAAYLRWEKKHEAKR